MSSVVKIQQPKSKTLGKVYTPVFLAQWVAEELAVALPDIPIPKVLDPACGGGELLAAFRRARSRSKIYGVDIDNQAIAECANRFAGKGQFKIADALIPNGKSTFQRAWAELGFPNKFDAIIANPPWGADLLHSRQKFSKTGYTLAQGQFDVWEVFIELAMSLLRQGGIAAFIIPDALFLPEHQRLREFLQSNYTIMKISRLGEGLFKGIYRGTVVLQIQNQLPSTNHKVQVSRLSRSERADILSGNMDLGTVLRNNQHYIAQKNFCEDEFSQWNIDTKTNERKWITAIKNKSGDWCDGLHTGRGVEVSKHGMLLECPTCRWTIPQPKFERKIFCVGCGNDTSSTEYIKTKIVRKLTSKTDRWASLFVGEDVNRYAAKPSRQLKLLVDGVKYKDLKIYRKRRLVIRKTGVGIKAAIVSDGSLTNQVVFHYYQKNDGKLPDFFLSYLLGVINSRIMFAYHLRVNGEAEWRSHPYLTQKIIGRFPIPVPKENTIEWKQALAIAHIVDQTLLSGNLTQKQDEKIEALVAGLYGFGEAGMAWVNKVISSAEKLEPMRELLNVDIGKIKPVTIKA